MPTLSIAIATRDRILDLTELLESIIHQKSLPNELLIIDDSPNGTANKTASMYANKLFANSKSIKIKYLRGYGKGLTSARNLAVKNSTTDLVLFLDDDIILTEDVTEKLVSFFTTHPGAIGVQPKIITPSYTARNTLRVKFESALNKALMLSYNAPNVFTVRKSGMSIAPSEITKIVKTQRLNGCSCYKKAFLDKSLFDTNLKRSGSMEDLDYSYRVFKKYPDSLYAIPSASLIHKASHHSRLQSKGTIDMVTTYWFYIFFKDVFDGSVHNLACFLLAQIGYTFTAGLGLITKRSPKCWQLIHILKCQCVCIKNLRRIRSADLEFINKGL